MGASSKAFPQKLRTCSLALSPTLSEIIFGILPKPSLYLATEWLRPYLLHLEDRRKPELPPY